MRVGACVGPWLLKNRALFLPLRHFPQHLLFCCGGRVALKSSTAAFRRPLLCHLRTFERAPRHAAALSVRTQRAAIVCVVIIQIRIGSDYTHSEINTLQSIDIILADC